ncbi:MAG: hypothetical protein U0234_29070 [Sandaracinus sp.]
MDSRGAVVVLAAALVASAPGCCCSGPSGPRLIGPSPVDAGRDAPFVFPIPDAAAVDAPSCRAIAPCDPRTCAGDCRVPAVLDTVRSVFGVPAGEDDPSHPGFARVSASEPDVPTSVFAPSTCVSLCTPGRPTGCDACARCSARVGQSPLVAQLGGIAAVVDYAHGACRPTCTFDPTGRGDCPAGTTCDPDELVCLEACSRDAECQVALRFTYDGSWVSRVVRADRCDFFTGRCVRAELAGPPAGTRCTLDTDCAEGDACSGGVCATRGCDPADASSCGFEGRGVCVVPGTPEVTPLCFLRCDDARDCAPGVACGSVGSTAVCTGRCTTSEQCHADEVCTEEPFGLAMSLERRCLPACDGLGARGALGGCPEGSACRDVGEGRGTCTALDFLCIAGAAPSDFGACAGGQVCDALAGTREGLGRCVEPCTSDDACIEHAGARCVSLGDSAGLCRAPCGPSAPCEPGLFCSGEGWCVGPDGS